MAAHRGAEATKYFDKTCRPTAHGQQTGRNACQGSVSQPRGQRPRSCDESPKSGSGRSLGQDRRRGSAYQTRCANRRTTLWKLSQTSGGPYDSNSEQWNRMAVPDPQTRSPCGTARPSFSPSLCRPVKANRSRPSHWEEEQRTALTRGQHKHRKWQNPMPHQGNRTAARQREPRI